MGRISSAVINHFSHPHPLYLTNLNTSQSLICSACEQTLNTEPFYSCKLTSYSLHHKCTQLPQTIAHPCHHQHPLSLLPKSQNPNGVFPCNACGKHGDGFSYICKDCDLSIHVVCSMLPLSLVHQNHSHPLSLLFSPPYGSNVGFSCDVCGVIGGNMGWLYRCGLCGFDAHLTCATSNVVTGRSIGPGNVFSGPILRPVNNQRDQYSQAIMGNLSNQISQTIMGGGGGMNNQIMQALMGGGGGGGGGGGADMVQLLMGSNGGVGGLDLSSVLGNGGDFGGLTGAGLGGFGF